MTHEQLSGELQAASAQILGYLNFSSGASDPSVLGNLDLIFQEIRSGTASPSPATPTVGTKDSGARTPSGRKKTAKKTAKKTRKKVVSDAPESPQEAPPVATWRLVGATLQRELQRLQEESTTFGEVQQARAVLKCVFEQLLPEYLKFHEDLLFHQEEQFLFNAFFVGRALEITLQQGGPWDVPVDTEAILRRFNDFIGHRPVASLETQKIEPYGKEWVRPIPLYIEGAGVCSGPHREVVELGLQMLRETDPDLLRNACFDPAALQELAVDPRAYDFDHPANKRPNYHFGQWDPHLIDGHGRYRRFVVQHVTLEALMARLVDDAKQIPASELVVEAAAVLAGTILMASGISGDRPDAHDSETTLANLLPRIAAYRDAFYERLFDRIGGEHAARLQEESRRKHQPFGGARQHLNAQLARRRASQLEHVQLASIFARMGYPEAAARQSNVVPVASARLRCKIDCLLTTGMQALEEGRLDEAARTAPEIVDWIRRAIRCGALIDPWNILGFDAHFSLFPALENSIHDHRADELIELMEQVLSFHSKLWSEAAARDDTALCEQIGQQFEETANWWRQFATHEVGSVESVDSWETYRAAKHVAQALNLWHKGGGATGDVRFWAPHADLFDSPQAYALVIDALLHRQDFVAAMSLLIHWLSQADQVPLEQADTSFYQLAHRWIIELQLTSGSQASPSSGSAGGGSDEGAGRPVATDQLVAKFLDYLEANAEQYWEVPQFEMGTRRSASNGDAEEGQDEPEDELYGAAYEGMVYNDSTDDGVDGEIFDSGHSPHDELMHESERLACRLSFISCIADLWRAAAIAQLSSEYSQQHGELSDKQRASLRHWSRQAEKNRRQLMRLLEEVRGYPIPSPSGDHDSMVEYDRRRLVQESLLERIIGTCVDVADAGRMLYAAQTVRPISDDDDDADCDDEDCDEGILADSADGGDDGGDDDKTVSEEAARVTSLPQDLAGDESQCIVILGHMLSRDYAAISDHWTALIDQLSEQPLLYVPLSKGGNPARIVACRVRQQSIQELLLWLPRIGLLAETCELIETARDMERNNPVGPGAVTEFDELFKIGYKAIVEHLVASSETWQELDLEQEQEETEEESSTKKRALRAKRQKPSDERSSMPPGRGETDDTAHAALVGCLEQLTETLLVSWLAHSRTLRLSVLERVHEAYAWEQLVDFVKTYGDELFTQRFLNLGNVRAILHQGVDQWLQQIEADTVHDIQLRLLDDLDQVVSRERAHEQLTLVLEAIVENYGEYRDYNSTTTQSDRGELLFTLLDFLRLRSRYDRICWNLKPVVLAHEILVRREKHEAARLWRDALTERIGEEAELYLERLAELQAKYAMRMPTVADRLAERFVRPMAIDRIRALVTPSIEQAGGNGPKEAFELLEQETDLLTRQPTGVGLDVPAWLLALEEEVERVRQQPHLRGDTDLNDLLPSRVSTYEDAIRQLDEWSSA